MSLLSLASNDSAWRGFDYYTQGKVASFANTDEGVYECRIKGSSDAPYHTVIDITHPRQSHCDCPHAKDRKIICKHMVALLFTAFPKEAENYLHEVEESEREEERRIEEHHKELEAYIKRLTKVELQRELYNALLDLEEQKSRHW